MSSLVKCAVYLGLFLPNFLGKAIFQSWSCCSSIPFLPLLPFFFSHHSFIFLTSFCWFFLCSFVFRTVNGISCLFRFLCSNFYFSFSRKISLSMFHNLIIVCNLLVLPYQGICAQKYVSPASWRRVKSNGAPSWQYWHGLHSVLRSLCLLKEQLCTSVDSQQKSSI